MFDLHPDVEPLLADPSIHPALRDTPAPASAGPAADRAVDGLIRMRAAIGHRLIAAGAALVADDQVRRPAARS